MAEPTPERDPHCIFCRIVAGEVPCHKVYEDDRVLAFLDVGPLSAGHTLVVPRAHARTLDEVSEADAAAIGALLPRLSRAVMRASGAGAWNVLQNNGEAAHQAVNHVHFHLIPKHTDGSGVGIDWPAGKLDDAQAKRLRETIAAAL